MRLFMQAGGATVELPNTSSADSVFTVSETVGFRDSVVVDNPVSSVDSLEEDIWKSIDMDRIDIVALHRNDIFYDLFCGNGTACFGTELMTVHAFKDDPLSV